MTRHERQLVVGVAELLREPGTQREVALTVPVAGIEGPASAVPDGAEAVLALTLESTLGEAVAVHGTVRAPWRGECRRCLEPMRGELETEVAELFERDPTDEESWPIVDDEVDLGPLVRELLLLALPGLPLCRPDCPGPSPADYPVTVEGEGPPPADPR